MAEADMVLVLESLESHVGDEHQEDYDDPLVEDEFFFFVLFRL